MGNIGQFLKNMIRSRIRGKLAAENQDVSIGHIELHHQSTHQHVLQFSTSIIEVTVQAVCSYLTLITFLRTRYPTRPSVFYQIRRKMIFELTRTLLGMDWFLKHFWTTSTLYL